jgi:hypothetical protein
MSECNTSVLRFAIKYLVKHNNVNPGYNNKSIKLRELGTFGYIDIIIEKLKFIFGKVPSDCELKVMIVNETIDVWGIEVTPSYPHRIS